MEQPRKLLYRPDLKPGPTIVEFLELDKPFIIDVYCPTRGIDHSPHLGLYFHRGADYPTFIDESATVQNESTVPGFCRIDIRKKRVLLDPFTGTGKWREMIQAVGGLDLLYPGYL